jgi:glycosyltransferase involved in cell wall biosynthesis
MPTTGAPRVLFLGAGLHNASWRFRVAQYLPHLRARGIAATGGELAAAWPDRLRLLASAARYDVVCVHRALLTPLELVCLRRAAPRYVFDFDDAIMFRDSAAARMVSRRRQRRVARMLRGAAAVLAGNDYLAAWAAPLGARVTVLPTAVDLAAYPVGPPADGPPTIGWIGTRSTLMYLRGALPALARLAARHPRLTVRVVSDGGLEAAGVPLRNMPWSLAEEVDELRRFQVGIMPLPDDPWTRGKCAVKVLQYFAAGLPVVCSPVGVARDIVAHGRNGFLASSDDEWVAHLDALLADADLRRRLGAAGRALVEERFSVRATLPRLVDALLGVAAPAR